MPQASSRESSVLLPVFIWLFALVLIGLRFFRFASLPPDLEGDGIVYGIHALNLARQIDLTNLIGEQSYLYIYAAHNLLLGFFFNLLDATRAVLILVSISLSLVTIAGFYLLARSWLGKRPALYGSFFLLCSLWFMPYSRYPFGFLILLPLFFMASLYFFFRYEEGREVKYLCWASLSFLAGLLNGYALILLVIPIALIYKIWIWRETNRCWDWRYLPAAAAVLTTYLFVTQCLAVLVGGGSPLAFFREFLQFRLGDVTVAGGNQGNWQRVTGNLVYWLKNLLISAQPEPNYDFHCLQILGFALLSPLASILFLWELLIMGVRRNRLDKLLLVWFFCPLILYSLILTRVNLRYYLVLLPLVYFVVGRGMYFLEKLLRQLLPKKRQGWGLVIIIVLCLYLFIRFYYGYFVHYDRNDAFLHRHYGMCQVSNYIEELDEKYDNLEVVIGDYLLVHHYPFRFYTWGRFDGRYYFWDKFRRKQKSGQLAGKTVAFVFGYPDNPRVGFLAKKGNLPVFKRLFSQVQPVKIIRHKDGARSKVIYVVKFKDEN